MGLVTVEKYADILRIAPIPRLILHNFVRFPRNSADCDRRHSACRGLAGISAALYAVHGEWSSMPAAQPMPDRND